MILAIVKRYKWQFIVMTFVFMVFLSFVLLSLPKTQSLQPSSLPSTRAQKELLFPKPISDEATFSAFLNTKVNKTSDTEIETLPDIIEKVKIADNLIAYKLHSPSAYRHHLLITENGILAFKNAVTIDTVTYQQPTGNSFKAIYGTPEATYTGSEAFGRFAKTLIYPQKGFAMIINPFTDEVFEIQQFKPGILQDYLQKWGGDIKEYSNEPEPYPDE